MSAAREAVIRPAVPEDMPRLRELAAAMSAHADRPFTGLPQLERDGEGNYRKPSYLLEMWVVEVEGEIRNAFYLEKAVEFCMIGTDPVGTAAARRFAGGPLATAQMMGLRAIHCLVPREFEQVGRHLDEMEFERTGYEHFAIRLV